MVRDKTILVGIDDTDASTLAVTYVAEMINGRKEFQVVLLHVLPPIPPELLEFGGSEDPQEEINLDEELKTKQAQWIEETKTSAQPVLEKAKTVLYLTGVSPEMVSTVFSESIHRPDVVRELIKAAHKQNCGTIAVGRKSYPLYQEMFHRHIGEELAGKAQGFAIWIIE